MLLQFFTILIILLSVNCGGGGGKAPAKKPASTPPIEEAHVDEQPQKPKPKESREGKSKEPKRARMVPTRTTNFPQNDAKMSRRPERSKPGPSSCCGSPTLIPAA
ncbi:unnamed protein product, partial [Mesorhabditis spiculigera]